MKRAFRTSDCARRGAVAPFVALGMVAVFGMVAFVVDLGYVGHAKHELQVAADAAALAGAAKIMVATPSKINTKVTNDISLAQTEVRQYAAYNRVGGRYPQLNTQDVVVGYQAIGSQADVVPWSSGDPFPNAVQVTVRRDQQANGPLSLFFAPVIGVSQWSGSAIATAAFEVNKYGTVTGFKPTAPLLPIGLDINLWNKYLASGQSPDGTIVDNFSADFPTSQAPAPLNVKAGADGVPELSGVYPEPTTPGNFGLLSFVPIAPGAAELESIIRTGCGSNDLPPNGFYATQASPATVPGASGWISSLVDALASTTGRPSVLPLFSSYAKQGAKSTYTIVGFAGVVVVSATGAGARTFIVFQPMVTIDPSAVVDMSSKTSGPTQFVYPSSPLTLTR